MENNPPQSSSTGTYLQSGFIPNIEVNRTAPGRARKKSKCKKCFEKVMPFTSTLSMLLILYIIKAYLLSYVPTLLAVANDPEVSKLYYKGRVRIYIEIAIFVSLSFSCLHILVIKLWCKCLPISADPGYTSRKMED